MTEEFVGSVEDRLPCVGLPVAWLASNFISVFKSLFPVIACLRKLPSVFHAPFSVFHAPFSVWLAPFSLWTVLAVVAVSAVVAMGKSVNCAPELVIIA